MRIFGFEISRKAMTAVDTRGSGGWFTVIREAATGWWQAHVTADKPQDVLAFSAVFACVTKIAGDIAKMRLKLVQEQDDGTCKELNGNTPYRAVLERPNHYQNRITFVQNWTISKLLHGNAYALKRRDSRGIVTALYPLDPQRVTPMVTDQGDVYYRLEADHLSRMQVQVIVPASEIIHDLMCPLWHPLVGVSPIYACGLSATMGNRIQKNSTQFFGNMSRPSGVLTSPARLEPADTAELKRQWEENYGGMNSGKTAVLGNGLKFEPISAVAAEQAQLIEQLKWTVEDVGRCFSMPLYKIGGAVPANASVESLNQTYYSECLQILIESMELCFKEGLALPRDYYVECDLDGLLRMDQHAMALVEKELVGAGIKAPDESRARLNLPPVTGGKTPYLQQQNYSLAALAKRDAKEDPFGSAEKPAPTAPPAANDERMDVAEARSVFRMRAKGSK